RRAAGGDGVREPVPGLLAGVRARPAARGVPARHRRAATRLRAARPAGPVLPRGTVAGGGLVALLPACPGRQGPARGLGANTVEPGLDPFWPSEQRALEGRANPLASRPGGP